jgi:hypothetical protein
LAYQQEDQLKPNAGQNDGSQQVEEMKQEGSNAE